MEEEKNKSEKNEYLDKINRIVDDMTLMDDDLMSRVFEDNAPATELLLSTLFGEHISVSESKGQVELKNPMVDGRNITLDICAVDENGRMFNCEVQRRNKGADPRRVRFHSSMLDVRSLKSNEDFDSIRDTVVIFITENDYFKGGKPLYIVRRNVNLGDTNVPFDDGNVIIYVNGKYDGDDPIGRLMSDFRNQNTDGFHYPELEKAIHHFKIEEGGRMIMCEAVEKFAREYGLDQFNKGVSEGRVEGRMEGRMEGRDEGLLESVRNVMKNLKMSSEQAMQSLGIPESDYPKYLSRL